MELEFDKEIDAILRRARGGGDAVATAAASPHLDADVIAAFAENGLPEKAKMLYTGHFADCDRCRKQLSHAIRMNTEADAATASSVSSPVDGTAIPWFQSLFKTPNLALAMGALVLIFSGVLGYLVLQKNNESSNATVSQITEPEPKVGVPYFGGEAAAPNSNSAATMANGANKPAASNAPATNAAAIPGTANVAGGTGRLDSADKAPPADDKGFALDGVTSSQSKPVAAAPAPPPTATDVTAGERDEKKSDAEKLKEENKDTVLAKRRQNEGQDRYRDAPPAAAKTGPARSGPMQNKSNQINDSMSEMAVARVVGGKTFNNRNGAWYDSAYRGQATTNYRRGTDEYKKLDRGIRNIADTLGGTVVLVWKEKAYRVQ